MAFLLILSSAFLHLTLFSISPHLGSSPKRTLSCTSPTRMRTKTLSTWKSSATTPLTPPRPPRPLALLTSLAAVSRCSMNTNTSHPVCTVSLLCSSVRSDCSTGIFMGLFASFLCIMILYIGISALSSLQVPYAAFERDTSAAVQKKQQ